jgi:precorrin-6B methylase 2
MVPRHRGGPVPLEDISNKRGITMNYNDYSAHRVMVRDEVRTTAFQKAIAATVKPGDVVLDVGAGSGVLSLFAAQAGAARVYAIERSAEAAAMARELVHANGFDAIVTVIESDIRQVAPPEPADLIVSEWMGAIGIDENMYGSVLFARDHWLKPDGRIIPSAVTAMAAPVAIAQRVDAGFFGDRPYGLDLSALGEPMLNELLLLRRRIEPRDLAAPARPLWTTTALTDPPDVVRETARSTLEFAVSKDVRVSALALWFAADLGQGVTLSNAPDAPDTHWGQMLLPLHTQLALAKGDVLHVELSAWPVGPGPLMFAWKWRANDGPATLLDTTGSHQGAPGDAAEAAEAMTAMFAAGPPPRSALARFLGVLAMDAGKLADFLEDPDAAMKTAGLSDAQIDALTSRDQNRIGMALFETGGVA